MIKLNLGCRRDIKTGYVNIDIEEYPNVVIMDVRKLQYSDLSVDEIYAKDILEHFSWRETEPILNEWNRVLKVGGDITIITPDISLLFRNYNNRPVGWNRDQGNKLYGDPDWLDIVVMHMVGHQDSQYNYHFILFDRVSISMVLKKTGFDILDINECDGANMIIKAVKVG